MNKYFLSLMSIAILFQSFKVADEIFFIKKAQREGYVVIGEEETEDEIIDVSTEQVLEDIDLSALLQNASLENGKKLLNSVALVIALTIQ